MTGAGSRSSDRSRLTYWMTEPALLRPMTRTIRSGDLHDAPSRSGGCARDVTAFLPLGFTPRPVSTRGTTRVPAADARVVPRATRRPSSCVGATVRHAAHRAACVKSTDGGKRGSADRRRLRYKTRSRKGGRCGRSPRAYPHGQCPAAYQAQRSSRSGGTTQPNSRNPAIVAMTNAACAWQISPGA